MDSFFVRFKNSLVLIVLVAAQTVGLAVQVRRPGEGFGANGPDRRSISLLRYWTVSLLAPAERVSHGGALDLRGLWTHYLDLRHTRQQNDALQQQVSRLRLEQAALAEDAAQGRRLQALLAFKQQYIASTVAAQVIGTSGSDRSRVVYLDKGSADGLRPDMAVITPDGVVGKLRDVFPHTAQLLLLSDLTSGAGVTLESSRIRGILQGAPGGRIQITNLTADSRIQPGEHVLTSGGDQVFPRGLPVGIIQSIAPDPQHQPYTAITVAPFANLARLEEVLVITGTSQNLSASAQQDVDQADATAEQAKRAAELVAERLPGLDKPDNSNKPGAPAATEGGATPPNPDADQTGGVPGIPSSGLPRTTPALHPDRYSPGATPPANDLKPGAPK